MGFSPISVSMLVCWRHKNIRYKIHYASRNYKTQSEVSVGMMAKYRYKYIQLQIHRLALVCWQPVSGDESESSPTVFKGHASLLNEIFGRVQSFCCLFIFCHQGSRLTLERDFWAPCFTICFSCVQVQSAG